jgi:hypothetical protein
LKWRVRVIVFGIIELRIRIILIEMKGEDYRMKNESCNIWDIEYEGWDGVKCARSAHWRRGKKRGKGWGL